MAIVTVGILSVVFYIQNKRADRGETKLEDPDVSTAGRGQTQSEHRRSRRGNRTNTSFQAELEGTQFRYTY